MSRCRSQVCLSATPAPSAPRGEPAVAGRAGLILQALADDDVEVTFTGLRRRLGIHPESLSRELRRAQEAGHVEKTGRAYRVTEAGRNEARGTSKDDRTEVLRLLLPPDLDAAAVDALLAERWFEALRWYGRSEGPGERVLLWLTEPEGRLVRVRILAGVLLVEVEGRLDGALESVSALAGLLAAVAALFGPRRVTDDGA